MMVACLLACCYFFCQLSWVHLRRFKLIQTHYTASAIQPLIYSQTKSFSTAWTRFTRSREITNAEKQIKEIQNIPRITAMIPEELERVRDVNINVSHIIQIFPMCSPTCHVIYLYFRFNNQRMYFT